MIKNIIICISALILIVLIILAIFYFSIEKDRERCMSMPFSEMMQDRSCAPYWEALYE